jgi:uroporphyrinogen decarboxylase
MMTSRERVLAVIAGRVPDRTPVDIGGTEFTGVTATAYSRLKAAFGVSGGHTRVSDPIACTVRVERSFREKLGADTVGLFVEPRRWRPAKLHDHTDILVPERWECTQRSDGDVFTHPIAELVCLRRSTECVFDYVNAPLAECASADDVAKKLQSIAFFDWPFHADEIASEFGARARTRRGESACALVLNVRARIAAGASTLRGPERFAEDLASGNAIAGAVLGRLADACIARLADVLPEVAPYADLICFVEGPCPGLSVDTYRSLVRPHHARVLSFIKKTAALPVVIAAAGLSAEVIREILELGVDCVAVARGEKTPSPSEIRAACGPIPLWGVGLGAHPLLAGPPEAAAEAVRRAIDKAGGTCIFGFDGLIGPDARADSLEAALDAARHCVP